MEEYFKIYQKDSMPLKEMAKVTKGDYVYTSAGDCFICVEDKHDIMFHEFHESVLNVGERIETLEPESLKLFWILSNKSFKKTNIKNLKFNEGDEITDTIKYGK